MKLLIFALLVALALGQDQEMEMEKEEMLDMLAPRLMDIMMKMTYMHMIKSMKDGKEMKAGLCPHVECALCVGGPESPFGSKMMTAMENCGIDMESDDECDSDLRMMDEECFEELMVKFGDKMEKTCCMLHELGWLTEEQEYAPEVIKADLESTLIADKLMETEAMCMEMSESLTVDCIAELEMCPFGSDMDEEDMEDCPCDMEEGEMRQEEEESDEECPMEAKKAARKAARKARRQERRKARRKERRVQRREDAMVLDIIKGMTYFGCIHHAFDEACMEKANEVLGEALMAEEEAGEEVAPEA